MTSVVRSGEGVRSAVVADLPQLVVLCAAHAAYERADPVPDDLVDRLRSALFSATPRAWCLVAESVGVVIGYATWSREFSTWHRVDHAYLDCLFVTAAHRGHGWGRLLLSAMREAAVADGATQLQWQTPEWNTDAVRFYTREGASSRPKIRFSMDLTAVR